MTNKKSIYIFLAVLFTIFFVSLYFLLYIKSADEIEVVDCGEIDITILQKEEEDFTIEERESITLALTCFNQSLLQCIPAEIKILGEQEENTIFAFILNNEPNPCAAGMSTVNYNIACPLPPEYFETVQAQYDEMNQNVTTILQLTESLNQEFVTKNLTGYCSIW